MRNQVHIALAGIAAVAMASAVAADFAIEALNLQPVPERVAAVIHAADSDVKTCNLVGALVDLDGDNNRIDWAATTTDGCGCGNVACPIWLVHDNRVVLSYAGYDLTLGREKQAGLRHVAIAASSAGWQQQSLWKFDGTKYIRVREKTSGVAH